MSLTIVWLGMLLIFWTFLVGVFFYIKGYTSAATKAAGMLNTILTPYLSDLAKDKSEFAVSKYNFLMDKITYFRTQLESFKIGAV